MTLSRADMDLMLQALPRLHAFGGRDEFLDRALEVVQMLIPGEFYTLDEVNVETQETLGGRSTPFEVRDSPLLEVFNAHMHEHPGIIALREGRRVTVESFSDHASRADWLETGYSREFYMPLGGFEDQMYATVMLRGDTVAAIVAARTTWGFSERDRAMIRLIRPHMTQAYRNAQRIDELQNDTAWWRQMTEDLGYAVVSLDWAGQVTSISEAAATWLFDGQHDARRSTCALPRKVTDWLAPQLDNEAIESALRPAAPLTLTRDGYHLVIRLLPDASNSGYVLLGSH